MAKGVTAVDVLEIDTQLERAVELDEDRLREMIDNVLDLHRHGDGYIVFANKQDGVFRHRDAVRACKFENMFPRFAARYLEDGHVSINASAAVNVQGVPGKNNPTILWQPEHVNPVRYGKSFHRERYMRRLNACYVDIDCYNIKDSYGREVTTSDVLEEVQELSKSGKLPAPTKYIKSGRGIWFLWHLHDAHDPGSSHIGCQTDILARYKDLNRSLVLKLAHFGADPVVDAARLTALHGTLKTKSGNWVIWESYPGGRSYSLQELESLMGIREIRSRVIQEAALDMGKPKAPRKSYWNGREIPPEISERCSRGHHRSAKNRLAHFDQLRAIRGSFTKGYRDKAAFVYAGCLRSAHISFDEALFLVRKFGEKCCDPHLSQSECDPRVKSAYSRIEDPDGKSRKRNPLTYQGMADYLEVTIEEAEEMMRCVGTPFPPARAAGVMVIPPTAKEKRRQRQDALLAINRVIGIAEMTYDELYAQMIARGFEMARGTLFNDLKRLGLNTRGSGTHEEIRFVEAIA